MDFMMDFVQRYEYYLRKKNYSSKTGGVFVEKYFGLIVNHCTFASSKKQ